MYSIHACHFDWFRFVAGNQYPILNNSENWLFPALTSPDFRGIATRNWLPALRNEFIFPVGVALFMHSGVVVVVVAPAGDGYRNLPKCRGVAVVGMYCSNDIGAGALLGKSDGGKEEGNH